MKKIQFSMMVLLMANQLSFGQLYSSGNNVIAGSTVGIGINTPSSATMLHIRRTSNGGNLYLENPNSTSFQTFRLTNDIPANYANYTKYGSSYAGGYAGISTMYPFANAFGFGNTGPMLNASTGNMGLAISKAGTFKLKLHIDASTERVGIGGNAVPSASVHINSALTSDTLKITNSTTGHGAGDGLDIMNTGNESYVFNRENGGLTFGTNNTTRMTISNGGLVKIGTTTTPAGYKLYVEQGILTEKIKVAIKTSGNWSDYVFADDYKLAPLSEVETYLKENKHLPGIPSANEVVSNGLDLAQMDAKLLEKVEELTLYIIKMEKDMNELKKSNELLKQQIQTSK